LIPKTAVGPLLVVMASPSLYFLCSILQAQKPMLIQTFLPKPAVERFDLGDKLRAVVHPDAFQHPILGHCQVEGRNHIIAFAAESYPDTGTNTAKVIHYR
jgi:hypothetical protein